MIRTHFPISCLTDIGGGGLQIGDILWSSYMYGRMTPKAVSSTLIPVLLKNAQPGTGDQGLCFCNDMYNNQYESCM